MEGDKNIENSNKHKEISKDLTEWMSAGNDSKVKFALFSTFHRVLEDLIMSSRSAKLLIIIQILQLCAMITNDSNNNLTEHISPSILRILKIPLIYPFLVGESLIITYLALVPLIILIVWIISGFLKIYRLPEK
jgi:hypothetical protein